MPLMLPTVVKNLFGGPATRMYPIQVREPFENARGHVVFDGDKCVLCGICALRCPAEAISINKETKELTFEPARCIVCSLCSESCKSEAVRLEFKWRAPYYKKPVEVHQAKGKRPARPAVAQA